MKNPMIYNNDLNIDFIPERLIEPYEKDLFIKKKEKIDEDNFVFDIFKDESNILQDFFEQNDEVISVEKKKEVYHQEYEERDKVEAVLKAQKRKWAATMPTIKE